VLLQAPLTSHHSSFLINGPPVRTQVTIGVAEGNAERPFFPPSSGLEHVVLVFQMAPEISSSVPGQPLFFIAVVLAPRSGVFRITPTDGPRRLSGSARVPSCRHARPSRKYCELRYV